MLAVVEKAQKHKHSPSAMQQQRKQRRHRLLNKPHLQQQRLLHPKKDGQALINGSDCRTCHKDDSKLIGPAYQDVAKKYENNAANVKMLTEKIIQGGQGNWGEIPMAGHPNLSQEDATAMVEYILSMKK